MDEPNEVCLGDKGWIRYEDNKKGILLCRYFWPVEKPKAVLLLVHGFGAHTCFEFLKIKGYVKEPGEPCVYEGSFIQKANAQGLYVCGFDSQGHGRSNGYQNLRCHFNKFQDYVDDTIYFAEYLCATEEIPEIKDLPIMILGVSLGGCIAVNTIHRRRDLFKGAILLAPMLSVESIAKKGLNPYLRPFGAFISAVAPSWCIVQLSVNEMFPRLQEAYEQDPLCYHQKTRARPAYENLRATEMTMREMPNMSFPFIAFHSKKDDMTDYEGTQKLLELSKSEDKTFVEVSDMWHFLIHEPGCEGLFDKIFEWIRQRI